MCSISKAEVKASVYEAPRSIWANISFTESMSCRFKIPEMMLNRWSISSCVWPTIKKEGAPPENILVQQGSHNMQICTYSYFLFRNCRHVFVKQEGVILCDFVYHPIPSPTMSSPSCCREHDKYQTTNGCTMQCHVQVHYKGGSLHIFLRYL